MHKDTPAIPVHVGFVVDGNRRWAKKHGLPAYEGHLAGFNALKDIAKASIEKGVQYVSFYVFSTENWQRSQDEVSHLMTYTLKVLTNDVKQLIKQKVRVRIIGSREGVSKAILSAIDKAEADTANFTRATVIFCFNYGGQLEIAEAAAKCAQEGITNITTQDIRKHLYDPDIPDVDMIVRTSGEQRISNFMLWRAAYSELMFIKKSWPDLRPSDVDNILKEFAKRQRRFGGS